ncbi:MAG TPA: TIGR03000 domain-containing protein [Gemmataceae bacterium]|nr:TIGR03000 domain-containing protein [Gemmataceae bacterium]
MTRARILFAILGLITAHGIANAQHGHGGAYHGGGYHGGYYHGGYYRGGYYPYYRGPIIGIGIGGYGYGYGYGYPYYYPPLAPVYAYPPPPTVVVQGGQPAQVAPLPNAPTQPPQTASPSTDMPPPKNAQIKVILPDAQAKVWFDNNPTSATGTERHYHTPDLTPGATNTYRIRASWIANGREVVQELAVPVQPGRMSVADFTRPPTESVAPPPLK